MPTVADRVSDVNAARWVGVAAGLLLGGCTLAAIGYETGLPPLLTGLAWAVVPVPAYLLLVFWLDRHEPEPLWAVAAMFFWGALAAGFFALAVNTYSYSVVAAWAGASGAEFFAKCVSAPVVEEAAKAAGILLLLAARREVLDGVVDGTVYATLVGLGFATTENVLYYARAALEGDPLTVFIARGVFMPYAHPLFTCLTGVAVGVAVRIEGAARRALVVAAGLALATCLHAYWNFAVYRGGGQSAFSTYLTVMLPLFLVAALGTAVSLYQERRVLSRHLLREVEEGLISPEEHAGLCTFRGRIRSALGALLGGGVRRFRLRMKFYRAAGDLAFHRNRRARLRPAAREDWREREALYLERFIDLRARCGS